jgi:hypothetical protein
METMIRVRQLRSRNTKYCSQTPKNRQKTWNGSPLRASTRDQLCYHLDLDFFSSSFHKYEGVNFCFFLPFFFLSHPVYDNFYGSSKKIIQMGSHLETIL